MMVSSNWTRIIVLLCCLSSHFVESKKIIQIGVPEVYEDGGAIRATVIAAVKIINNNSNILKGYELEPFLYAPQPNRGTLLKGYFKMNYDSYNISYLRETREDIREKKETYRYGEEITPMANLGFLRSSFNELMYPFYTSRNTLLLNYDSGGEKLQYKKKFPYLVNTVQPLSVYTRATVQYLAQFQMKKIAMLYITDAAAVSSSNKETVERFEKQAGENGLNIEYISEIPATGLDRNEYDTAIRDSLKIIKKKDIRIIVLVMQRDIMKTLVCEAYRLEMYGKKYQYFQIVGDIMRNWVKDIELNKMACSAGNQSFMAKNMLVATKSSRENDDIKTELGLTGNEIWEKMMEELAAINGELVSYHDRLMFVFDSVLAFSLGLQKVLEKEPSFVDTHTTVYNETRLEMLTKEIFNLQFQGASGFFKITDEKLRRFRDGNMRIQKMTFPPNSTGDLVPLAMVKVNEKIVFNKSQLDYTFPRDRPEEIQNVVLFTNSLVIVLWVLSAFGILIALILLAINVVFRNVTFIKLSSPNVNSLTCIGSLLLYVAVICYGLDTRYIEEKFIEYTCNIITFLMSMGFTLTFGSLFSKTWRIYRIFTRAEAARYVVIKDIHLFTVVFLMLVVDAVLCFSWMGVSPFKLESQIINEYRNYQEDTIEMDVVHRCKCRYQTQFLLAMIAYKGVLMFFGLFVAYETRKIKVEAINDSSFIGVAVYNVALFSTLGAIVVFSLYDTDRFQEGYLVFALCILQITTVTICLVFIPKIVMLITNYDDPNFKNGRPVLETNNSHSDYSKSDSESTWKTNNSQCALTVSNRYAV